MRYRNIDINCNGLSYRDFHTKLKESLGFTAWYGMNWDALYDCLRSMRFPADGLSEVTLDSDEILIITLKDFSKAEFDIHVFMNIIKDVNQLELKDGRQTQVLLNLI